MSSEPKYEAELDFAFRIASEAGKMILEGSKKRWAAGANAIAGGEGGNEPGTKKNSVDVRLWTSLQTAVVADFAIVGLVIPLYSLRRSLPHDLRARMGHLARHGDGPSRREIRQGRAPARLPAPQVHRRGVVRRGREAGTYGRADVDYRPY